MNFSRAEPLLQTQGTIRRRRGESIQPMFSPKASLFNRLPSMVNDRFKKAHHYLCYALTLVIPSPRVPFSFPNSITPFPSNVPMLCQDFHQQLEQWLRKPCGPRCSAIITCSAHYHVHSASHDPLQRALTCSNMLQRAPMCSAMMVSRVDRGWL